jgi:structure-specific endonuclease subunit SLX1
MDKKYYCYIIKSTNPLYQNITYNGSTNDLKRRLRQHNGEIVGGAKATKGKGPWEYYAILEGFETHKEALSCEWRIKHPTNHRIRPKGFCGVKGRIKAFNIILSLECWTGNSDGLSNNKIYNLYLLKDYIDLIDTNNIKKNVIIKNLEELE